MVTARPVTDEFRGPQLTERSSARPAWSMGHLDEPASGVLWAVRHRRYNRGPAATRRGFRV